MARKTGVALADHLSDSAVSGFKKAHEQLTQANVILEAEKRQREEDAIEWQKEIEEAIENAKADAKAHEERLARNQRVLGKLSELI